MDKPVVNKKVSVPIDYEVNRVQAVARITMGKCMSIAEKSCPNCGRNYKSEADYLQGTSRWRQCEFDNLWFNCSCQSTLMIPKGEYDWFSPEKTLNPLSKSVFSELSNIEELPRIPHAINKVQVMIKDENSETKAIAATLRQEPLTAATVIQYADKVKMARAPLDINPIRTLEHAITYIGRNALQDMLLVAGLKGIKFPDTGFNYDNFWKKSILTGAIAERICTKFNYQLEKDEAYLAAVLCNVGKLVACFCFPEQVSEMVKRLKDPKSLSTWMDAEAMAGIPDHTILGDIAVMIWGLPPDVGDASRWHHADPTAKGRPVIATVAGFANQLAHWIMSEPHLIDKRLLVDFCKLHKLKKAELCDWVEKDLMKLREDRQDKAA